MPRPTRRELLATLLGVPAALSAGCAGSVPLPPGELVGASVDLGHRLRGSASPVPTEWQSVPVVIVGAGVAGLSAAWTFLRNGFDRFVLLELESVAGGTSRAGQGSRVNYPWGAHYLPAPLGHNKALLRLLGEMDLIEGQDADGHPVFREEVLCRDPQERLYAYGQWFEGLYLSAGASEEDLRQRTAFNAEVDRWVGWRDGKGRRAFTVPLAACSDDPEVTALDRLSMAEWLDQHQFTSPRLRWVVDYACRDDYGCRPEHVSAWAGLFYFASRRRAPGAESQPLLTWPEGNGRLVAHLVGKARQQFRPGQAVVEIQPTQHQGRPTLEVTAWQQERGSERVVGYRCDQVIFAAPQFLSRFVIRPFRRNRPRHLADFEYGSWMVANLHLDRRPVEGAVPACWDNVLYDSPSLGYVIATHQACQDFGPTVWTYYYPLVSGDPAADRWQLLQLGRDEWAECALADLERPHPQLRRLVARLDVARWGHAMIRPRPGFLWGASRRQAAQPYRGIHFAHSDLSGLALFEEAFYHGVRAAGEVLHGRGEPWVAE